MRKLFSLVGLATLLVSSPAFAQEFPTATFESGLPSSTGELPPEAYQTGSSVPPVPTTNFGSDYLGGTQGVGGYDPYFNGSFESLNYESFNSNVGPNCGFVAKVEARDNSRFQESTELRGSLEFYSNKCKDYEKIETIRQESQITRSEIQKSQSNLNTCLQVRAQNPDACPRDVLNHLLGL